MKHVIFLLAVFCLADVPFGQITVQKYSENEPLNTEGATQISKKKSDDFRRQFLTFCDLAVSEFNKEIIRFADRDNADPATHHMPFFEDAHAARALAVAYDMTGETKYLAACRRWSNRIIEYQNRMIPTGAYYMNHSRAPGEDKGQWNVADSGSIAMGVLTTAIRCENPAEKAKYLESVKSFAKLVMDNYVGPEGGISNGLWPTYDGQWWCSTATFGTTAFLLYEETAEKKYLEVAKGALEWMTHQHFRKVKPITFQQRPSGIIFYCFELYATGLKYLEPGSLQYKRAISQIDLAMEWMAANQKTRGADVPDYLVKNVDMAGLPYLMYSFARQLPQYRGLTVPADRELDHIGNLLLGDGTPNVSRLMVWEVMTWGMMSYAERLSPGAMHRTSKQLISAEALQSPPGLRFDE
ncbi:MAG: glycoside hydrolase family 76 protein [Planctomycetota bacterium]|jgi:rhamnogalacturonyl hydrolase YesR